MPTLIVAATSPGAGKTALTAAIASHLAGSDREVTATVAWSDSESPDLAATLAAATAKTDRAADPTEPIASEADSATSALAAAVATPEPLGSAKASVADIATAVGKLVAANQVLVLEGKTGDHADNLALAEEVDGLVLLVSTPSDDILEAASSYGSRLAGVVINAAPRYQVHEVESRIIPELQQANINVLGWLPEDRRMLAPTVGLVADHLSAEIILNEEESGRLVDNFLIGGMVLDWGPFYFGSQENVGVVVRGDRPDIQLAALQTDTVRAMVLTKGARPVEYVIYEASQRGVPLVMTDGSTEETAEKLEGLLERIGFDHPDKLARMRELATERLDLDGLDAALSQPVTQ